jgi:uncharacterized protein (TIGR03067 family)
VGIRLRVGDGEAVFDIRDGEFRYRLGVDPSCSPKRMDLVDTDDYALPMIYKVEGRRLVIAASLFEPRDRVAPRPTEFRSKAGGTVNVLTFEKEP